MDFSLRKPSFEKWWPNLKKRGYRRTHPESPFYNCFAWAVGSRDYQLDPAPEPTRPDVEYYWPPGVPTEYTLEAFTLRLAVYGVDDLPRHAARQLENGMWTSKIGPLDVIEHTLDAFENATTPFADYGTVLRFFKRPIPVAPA